MRKIAGRIMCVHLAAVLMAGLIPTVYVPKCVSPSSIRSNFVIE